MNCQHLSQNGDNYGVSCADCGERLRGFGYGGWFGRNISYPLPQCIHLFSKMGEVEICLYCEAVRPLAFPERMTEWKN